MSAALGRQVSLGHNSLSHEWIATEHASYTAITAAVADPILERRAGRVWWIAIGISFALVVITLVAIGWLFTRGIGVWGVNSTIVWGYAIANYVWWIGIGNAGTLISSMLLLTRQRWRSSINRFAETMTLFAASIAGLFPILHLGRPMYFYWLAPYPNTMLLWPQWRSALIWDFWAILCYILFSLFFWYVGLLPDLATMRDRARTPLGRALYGAFALGWRGSARHWHYFKTYYPAMAALAVPLVCSVHSIVGLDFAASLMPGWQESIFPPYFVVGAMFSGFAMVVVLTAAMRWGLSLQAFITIRHFDVMAKILLMGSIVMGYSYATEWFMAWYGGDPVDRSLVAYMFAGSYAPLYWILLLCNCILPQALWFPRVRRSIPVLVVIAILINVGMWLERILIIWNTLSHDYMPPLWRLFYPTIWDWALLFGPLGLFALLFLCFARLVPAVSMHEVRQLCREEKAA
ncbi:NrfD/PsrC family molybdoenzyme membrane anchor subunit [Microvirga sp. 2MCAF38]|uniref:NrfD/PsrC family molybdoenzyme membrane anchor subunit n=1 Tax=Microvirga sp. 2MCAF38 TaxID=3232989 RepID=UPI003F99BDD7